MPMIAFHCPLCHTTLKTANPDAVGRMLRCPKCAERFSMPGDREREALAVRLRPVPPPPPSARDSGEQVLAAGAMPAPPISVRRRVFLAAVTLACLAVVLGLGGATYFAWDHITGPSRNHGNGDEEPLALIPANSDVVIRINTGALIAADPTLANSVEQHIRSLGTSRIFYDSAGAVGIEPADLFHQLTYGIHLPRNDRAPAEGYYTLVIRSRMPFSQARVARAFRAAPREMFNKTYYQLEGEMFHILYMPSDHTIVLTRAPTRHVAAMMQSDGTQSALSSELEPLIRRCERGHFWAVQAFSPPVTDEIRTHMDALPWSPRAWKSLVKDVSEARAVGFWTRINEGQMSFRAGLLCTNQEGAERVASATDSLLTASRIGGADVQEAIEKEFISALRPSVRLLLRSGKCDAQDTLVVVAAKGDTVDLHPALRELPQHLLRVRGQMYMPHGPMPMPPMMPAPDVPGAGLENESR
jgi:hypothetical protein